MNNLANIQLTLSFKTATESFDSSAVPLALHLHNLTLRRDAPDFALGFFFLLSRDARYHSSGPAILKRLVVGSSLQSESCKKFYALLKKLPSA